MWPGEFGEYVVRTPAFSFAELFKDNETIDLDMVGFFYPVVPKGKA